MRGAAGQFALVVSILAATAAIATADLRTRGMHLPLAFERNVGQADPDATFFTRGRGYAVSLRSTGPRLSLDGAPLEIEFIGANSTARLTPHGTLPGTVNYFLGSNSAAWRTDVPTFRTVRAGNVYEGIDVVYYGTDGRLEYDFVIAPGVDASVIRVAFRHASGLRTMPDGQLAMVVGGRPIQQRKPDVYQDLPGGRHAVTGRYVVGTDGLVRFALGPYDRSRPLVIDPVLVYSSYLGGPAVDGVGPIAVDRTGSVYLAGSVDAPTGFTADIAVTKIDPTGSFVVYSTYFGGSELDYPLALAVDPSGSAYIAGATRSTDFPTRNAFQPSYGGGIAIAGDDGFVAKLGPRGDTLVYSTYLGGSSNEEANAIAVTPGGEAVVVGSTRSMDFPIRNAMQPVMRGPGDVFVTRIAASGASLVYSTFFGGSAGETAFGTALDSAGNVYVGGGTDSIDLPLLTPYQADLAGGIDGFVVKLAPDASAILYATYLGGTSQEFLQALAVTGDGRAIVCGETISSDFPTINAAQPDIHGFSDAFVVLLDAGGATASYATYYGGSDSETCAGVAIDRTGQAHVTGDTRSGDFPLRDALQQHLGGVGDVFVTTIAASGAIVQSTYLGGSMHDSPGGIAVDPAGAIYVAGGTQSTDFPVTPTAFQRTPGGRDDGFVSKLGPMCAREVTADLDIATVVDVKLPLSPWRIQLVLVHNRGAEPIGGPLAIILTQATNGVFVASPYTTSCVEGSANPFTILTGGLDGILSPGEIDGQLLIFYEPGVPVSFVPRVLSGVPGR